ncbi:MAG: Monooxygenase [Caulobacter sp.]|nr:Monooxygenase [Caulobacter sp.]
MKTDLCRRLGIDLPIFAFSHCRDVVAEVSKAGGLGVLGASGFTADQLKIELDWLDAHTGGRPYGVDVLIPNKFEKVSAPDPETLEKQIPPATRAWFEATLTELGAPPDPQAEATARRILMERMSLSPEQGELLLAQALERPNVCLIVSALGITPPHIIAAAHARGKLMGALVGAVDHALKQKAAGIDVIIAQGTEAGGHTGEIATMVLTPAVVDAVAPLPVLAAGGIARGRQVAAALALGAQGVWCGSLWLTTRQSEISPLEREKLLKSSFSDTVRTRAYSGKPMRGVKSLLQAAWEREGAPKTLPMPLQAMLTGPARVRIELSGNADLVTTPVGQVVGFLNDEPDVRQVINGLLSEFADTVERLQTLAEG